MNSYAIHGSGIRRIYEALYSMPHEEMEDGQGLTCKYANNLTIYLLSGFTYSELWEGDKSFNNNSLHFFISQKDFHCISDN